MVRGEEYIKFENEHMERTAKLYESSSWRVIYCPLEENVHSSSELPEIGRQSHQHSRTARKCGKIIYPS